MGKKVKTTGAVARQNLGAFVVTGASRGLGQAIALEAAIAGYPLALIARSKTDLEKAKKEIQAQITSSVLVSIHNVDLTKQTEVEKAFLDIKQTHGKVRALINNAATWISKPLGDVTKADIQTSFDLNFYTAFHATQALLKQKTKSDLAIINIGATASLQGWPEVLPFCLGKVALRTYAQALSRELGPKGVHVAHLVIDGVLDNKRTRGLNPKTRDDQFINMQSVAKSVLQVVHQDRSCWTFEWDVRPYRENW